MAADGTRRRRRPHPAPPVRFVSLERDEVFRRRGFERFSAAVAAQCGAVPSALGIV
jgi:hypothetical protein